MKIKRELIDILSENCSEIVARRYAFNEAKYFLGGYDLVNAAIVYNQVISSQPSGIAIFHPTSTLFLVNAVNAALFAESLQVITSGGGVSCGYSPGDKVIYKGSLGVFQEECVMSGRESLKILFGGKGNLVIYLPKTEISRLVPYSGRSEKLRGFKNKKSNDSAAVLTSMFSMNRAALSLKDRSVVAVVTERKDELVDCLRALTIDGHLFVDLFTTEVFSGAERSFFIGRSRLKEKTALAIFSSLNVLDEYLNTRDGFSTLIVEGRSRIRNRYGILNSIKDLNKSKNVFVFLNSGDLTEVDFLKQNDFRIWSWLKSDFDNLVDRNDPEHPFPACQDHIQFLDNLRWQNVDLVDVLMPRDVLEAYNGLMSSLKKLRKMVREIDHGDLNEFFMICYGLLLHYAHLPVPVEYLNKCEGLKFFDIGNAIIKLFNLCDSLSARVLDDDSARLLKALCCETQALTTSFACLKGKELLDVIHTNRDYEAVIVVRKGWHVPVLQGWLSENGIGRVDVVDLSTVKQGSFSPVDRVIVMGCFGQETALIINRGIAKKITVLFYPFERRYIDYYLALSQRNVEGAESRAGLLGVKQNMFDERKALSAEEQDTAVLKNDIFSILNEITAKVSLVSYPYQEGDEIVEARRVVFDDGSCAFLTRYYAARRLDRISGKIENVLPEEIEVENELVFVDDARRDILEELIELSESSPVWAENNKVARIWKHALKKIGTNCDDPVALLQEKLAAAGCERHRATVENWFNNDKLIAPDQEELVFSVISEMTGDLILKERTKDIIDACRKIRAFHIKLGKYLVSCILKAANPEAAKEFDEVIAKRIADLAKHTYVLQIRCIAPDWGSVPRGKVNRVLELGE